jgi:anti-sigma factor RsiW
MKPETLNVNIALALGPCADYEFDLVELSEQALAPERAPLVQQHLAHCPRCRAYLEELVQLDAALAAALPTPEIPAGFDARLAERIAGLQRAPDRAGALAAAEREHQQLLRQLGRALDWRTVLQGVAMGAATGGALLALDTVAPGLLQANGLVPSGLDAATTYALVLAAAFVVGGISFARRIAGGLLLRAGG